MPRAEVSVRATHGTHIIFLQNDAGYARWGPTPERLDALRESYRPGLDKERDAPSEAPVAPLVAAAPTLAQPATPPRDPATVPTAAKLS